MKINQIQSQLAYNRQQLANMHWSVAVNKEYRSVYLDDSDCVLKEILKDSKRIATLAALQKALKKDLARELMYERAARQMNLIKASVMSNVGEQF
mgnify:CR=1 FL=1